MRWLGGPAPQCRAAAKQMPKPRQAAKDELVFEMVPAISISADTAPVLIPTVMDGLVRCVPITVRAGWLTQLVEQRRRRTRDTAAVVLEFCELVEAALKSLAPADASGGSAQEGQDSQDSGPLKGRAALGLDEDSDEDVLARADTGSTSIKVKKVKPAVQDFVTIKVGGFAVTVKRQYRGRGLLMPLDGTKIIELVRHLRRMADGDERRDLPKKLKRQRSETHNALTTDEDQGRLKWLFGTHQWQVHYKDEAGRHRSCTKGLVVPRADLDGRTLSESVFRKHRSRLLQKARMRWNELDKSGADRYAAPMAGVSEDAP